MKATSILAMAFAAVLLLAASALAQDERPTSYLMLKAGM